MKQYEHRLAQTDGKYSIEWIDEWIDEWRGFAQEVAFDSNVVVVDSKNIIVTNEQPALSNWFKEFGITLHPVNLRHGGFWDGGVHCLSLDIKRDGEKRNIV
jgi:N-dimethylarginine dimethylaminohydrolase